MAKAPGKLFFSTMKRAARLQRKAMKLASLPPARKRPKAVKKKTAKAQSPAAKLLPTGKGAWQNFVHHTRPARRDALNRLPYSVYRPAGVAIAGCPLVVMLHGCRQTPHEMALGTRMNRLADRKGFVVAYPQQTQNRQSMQCWRWFQPDNAHGLAEANAIADLAGALVRKHRLDAKRVYVAGLSAGAGMAALTALLHREQFAAVAMHSGPVVGAAHSAAAGLHVMRRGAQRSPVEFLKPLLHGADPFLGMPAIILHGRRDRAVSSENAMQLAQQFSTLNHASTIKERNLAQGTHRQYTRQDFTKGGKVIVRLCWLNEVGHAWSGGDSTLKFNSEKGPDASLLIWEFFSMH